LQVGNTHATRRAIIFKNLNLVLREIDDIVVGYTRVSVWILVSAWFE